MQLEAVGDVCLRFFDQNGNLINSSFNDRVLAISPKQLKAVPPADWRGRRTREAHAGAVKVAGSTL
jgi:hypothetical protein